MGDPRDAARAWLVEVLEDAILAKLTSSNPEDYADAILNAPGVEVEMDRLFEQVVIRLPAQPIKEET